MTYMKLKRPLKLPNHRRDENIRSVWSNKGTSSHWYTKQTEMQTWRSVFYIVFHHLRLTAVLVMTSACCTLFLCNGLMHLTGKLAPPAVYPNEPTSDNYSIDSTSQEQGSLRCLACVLCELTEILCTDDVFFCKLGIIRLFNSGKLALHVMYTFRSMSNLPNWLTYNSTL